MFCHNRLANLRVVFSETDWQTERDCREPFRNPPPPRLQIQLLQVFRPETHMRSSKLLSQVVMLAVHSHLWIKLHCLGLLICINHKSYMYRCTILFERDRDSERERMEIFCTWGKDTGGVHCEIRGMIVTPLWPPMTGTWTLLTSRP